MKNILISIIKYILDKVKRNKFIQNLFEAPINIEKFAPMGEFTDSFNNKHKLFQGLRTKIKPGWETQFKPQNKKHSTHSNNLAKQNGDIAVNKIIPILSSLGKSIQHNSILEIGCHIGTTSFSMADLGAKEVIATEFSGYKIESVDQFNKDKSKLQEINQDLKNRRNQLSTLYKFSSNVKFVDDDICNSNLNHNYFDIICSWDVLEHIHDTQKAFNVMFNLLKEDGLVIHLYNPFYSLNGGHSLCTLDFLWGHARLSNSDFSSYLDDIRPEEKNKALSFYEKGLNRMSLHDLKKQMESSGLKIISIIPFTKEQHIRMINKDILSQSQKNYPNITMIDLASPKVIVLAKKST